MTYLESAENQPNIRRIMSRRKSAEKLGQPAANVKKIRLRGLLALHRSRLALMLRFFVATYAYSRSFCKFIGKPRWTTSHPWKKWTQLHVLKICPTAPANARCDLTDSPLSVVERDFSSDISAGNHCEQCAWWMKDEFWSVWRTVRWVLGASSWLRTRSLTA